MVPFPGRPQAQEICGLSIGSEIKRNGYWQWSVLRGPLTTRPQASDSHRAGSSALSLLITFISRNEQNFLASGDSSLAGLDGGAHLEQFEPRVEGPACAVACLVQMLGQRPGMNILTRTTTSGCWSQRPALTTPPSLFPAPEQRLCCNQSWDNQTLPHIENRKLG